jgi:hypothetical protein
MKEGKTSGNTEIDEIIFERQQQTLHFYDNLEWTPFVKFKDIKPIGEGGFVKIYSAIWLEGAPKYYKKKRLVLNLLSLHLKNLKIQI